MHHFVRSHVLPSVPSRVAAVAPVSAHHVVPSVPLAVCALVARVSCFRLASVGPFGVPALVPALPPQASAVPGSNGYAPALGRPPLLGRAGRAACVRRGSSSARRGRRLTSADSQSTGVACNGGGFVSRLHCGSSALALARFLGAPRVQPRGPTRRSTPFPSVTGRCAIKPRSAGHLLRWASKVMHHFVRFHVLSPVPSRLPAVAPVSACRVVPSVPLAVRALVARVLCFRLASGGPFVAPALVPALLPQASAVPGSNGYATALGRPLSLGRAGHAACVRRVSSSARRGRRIASADSCATGVACGGGGCVSRLHRGSSALALARFLGAPRVQPRGPTRRSTPFPSVTGRCAIKPVSYTHLTLPTNREV